MKHLIILIFLVISLFGDHNPRLYALLGDKLFDANIQLEHFKIIKSLSKKIEIYQNDSALVRKEGLLLEDQKNITASGRKGYLKSLRNLDLNYKSLIGVLQQELLNSIQTNNYSKFTTISNSGLTDIFENSTTQTQAIVFYEKNRKKGQLPSIETLISNQKIKRQHAEARQKEYEHTYTKQKIKKEPSFLRIIINTSDLKNAGTSSIDVKFGINGKYNKSYGILALNNHKFRTGGTEVFDNIKIDIPLSEIHSISLKVEGHNAWHINNISFQFFQKNEYTKEYKLDAKQWFSSEPADLNRGVGCVVEKSFYL